MTLGAVVNGAEQMAQQTDAAYAACQPFTSRLIAINEAAAMALSAVPGIGPATAGKIVEYREEHGPFHSAADLTLVPGIGAAKAARFAAYLSFE
jgi:competence protein ComEA